MDNKTMNSDKRTLQFEQELQSLRLENRNLGAQLNQLQHELLQVRRVRTLIKLLAKAIDAAVIACIRRLNESHVSHRTKPPLQVPNSKDVEAILKTLRIYDLNIYYTLRSGDRLVYKVVYNSYMFVSRSLLRLAMGVRRVARRGYSA